MARKKSKRPRRVATRRSSAARKGWAVRREKAQRRSDAARKGWVTRKRKARALEKQRGKKRGKAKKRPPPVVARIEWEVTISYREKDGHRLDVTVRVETPTGTLKAQVESAVRRAIHGNSLSEYRIHWIDWQRFTKHGNAASMKREGTGDDLATMKRPLLAGRWRTAPAPVAE